MVANKGNTGVDDAAGIDADFFMEFEFSRVDMREIEDVVDDVEEVLAAPAN